MGLRINQNVLALQAHRNLLATEKSLNQAVQRLSSGLRINAAADDPAGLAISEKMRAQIASTEQATRNANYAVNLLQTAEGALSTIDEKLVRMRQLAVEAASGTLTDEDRSYAETEFQALKNEITRIAEVTEYNTKKLIDGAYSSSGISFHVGIHNVSNEDKFTVTLNNMTASGLGVSALTVSNIDSAAAAISVIDVAIKSKDTERTKIGANVERLTTAIANLQTSYENAVASESQIRDADVAMEMANFVRANILMQSGVAMMAQANMLPQTVAGLLG